MTQSLMNIDGPIVELAAETQVEESEIAIGLVDALTGAGWNIGDILVVVRNANDYEDILELSAQNYQQPISVWDQLPLISTEPYALIHSTCQVLSTNSQTPTDLLTPLWNGWVPISEDENENENEENERLTRRELVPLRWYLESSVEASRSLSGWQTVTDGESPVGDIVGQYLDWLRCHSQNADPDNVKESLHNLLESYREGALRSIPERDSQSYSDTIETARAYQRMIDLIDEVVSQYARWLQEDRKEQSWTTVTELIEETAERKAGTRDHANAEAVDVVEANDTLWRKRPVVVMLGMVDGQFPLDTSNILPNELVRQIVHGNSPETRLLGVPTSGTEAAELDQFYASVAAAKQMLVVCRYERDTNGVEQRRSPFLDRLGGTECIEQTDDLLPPNASVPADMASILDSLDIDHNGQVVSQ